MTIAQTSTAKPIPPSAIIHLSPQLLAAPSISALFPLAGRMQFDTAVSVPFTLCVKIGDRSEAFVVQAEACRADGQGNSYFDYELVLNTFVFADGQHDLSFYLEASAADSVTHTTTIKNDSTLGATTRSALARFSNSRWIWRQGDIDSAHFPMDAEQLRPWFDRDDARDNAPAVAAAGGLDKMQARSLEQFIREGYCILPQRVDESLLEQLNTDLDAMLARGEIELHEDGDHRVEHIHSKSAAAQKIWTLPAVMQFLRVIFQEEALPCQTLVFLRGSGQDVHQDTIHLTAFPAGYMCGVWIALEDIKEESGPLFVYPGSHRTQRIYCDSVGMAKVHDGDWSEFAAKFLPRLHSALESGGFKKQTYLAKRGDILVWHENLAHGGTPREAPGLSRRSIVSHYFSQGAAAWYDSTGRSSGVLYPVGAAPQTERFLDPRRWLRGIKRLARGL